MCTCDFKYALYPLSRWIKGLEHLFAVKILGAKVFVNPRTLAVAKVQISWVCDHNSLVVNKAHDYRKSSRDADGLN